MPFFKLIVLIFCMPSVYAIHLAPIGPVYPIGEENAIHVILKKLHQKAQSGELQKRNKHMAQRAIKSITHMKPIAGFTTVTTRTQRLIDPTVTYKKAITTPDGRIVVAAGTRINPLDSITLSKRLLFFDGRDPMQCKAVQQLLLKNTINIKPILIAGSWLDLTKAWKTQVFYDQQGNLSQRLGIRAVPALVSQQGNQLRIDEIPPKELR